MNARSIILDGQHTSEALAVLSCDIRSPGARGLIVAKAAEILRVTVDPRGGPPNEPSDGLLYGLIQSGKTSVIIMTAAMAADNGFECLTILTSDINPLYEQTLNRIRRALRGLTVMGKGDWADPISFARRIISAPFAIVCSKNGSTLRSLLEAFKHAGMHGAKGLPTLIIDDEADQASLNTYASRDTGQYSTINDAINELRAFFPVNTYLQVTATPQALFLQRPDHQYRPSFTVMSAPGEGYMGGESFFAPDSPLLQTVDLDEVDQLRSNHQPPGSPSAGRTQDIPQGLRRALLTFFMGAAAQNCRSMDESFAFLCHVSHAKIDHRHVVEIIDRFKSETSATLRDQTTPKAQRLIQQLRTAYDDLLATDPDLPLFDQVVARVTFLLPGASIKLIDSSTKDAINLDHVFSIFVGGNKLSRGVTIPNLITSYYGRNPKKPNSDTVLQHARMYGYRQRNITVTRLFLPQSLAEHFRMIHQMESALREHLELHPNGDAVGLFLQSPLQTTRRNVLEPNNLGVYVAGKAYNPAYPLRTPAVARDTTALDQLLEPWGDDDGPHPVSPAFVNQLLGHCKPDPKHGTGLWNSEIVQAAITALAAPELFGGRAFVAVRRGRRLNTPRRETQGIHDSDDKKLVRRDAPTLFMFRQDTNTKGESEVWWPQIRFPGGAYWFSFSFDH